MTRPISFTAVIVLLFSTIAFSQSFSKKEIANWKLQSQNVTIIRDNWGIPHVYGKTDADCVFGLMYAQCEDDFTRVEMNYIDILGRTAEITGESGIYTDLYTKLVIDSAGAVADYAAAPEWLKKLLIAYADGLNYYLYKNPSVKPRLIKRFEPWFPLMWTDGSIAAISTGGITPEEVKNFYSAEQPSLAHDSHKKTYKDELVDEQVHSGSNGFAIAPSRTASGKPILYINPHVTYYFRPEVHMVSEEGLNAYGAVTWGQFFIYQGFNEKCGWMHTSGYSDVADAYIEEITQNGTGFQYRYDGSQKPVTEKILNIRYRDENNSIRSKNIKIFSTGHGPVMAKRDGKWITVKSVNRSMTSLIQSWQRTKATGFESFKKNMDLLSNASNNTVYADAEGNIAYWHGNFIPRKDASYDWTKPVDGTTSATEWKGLHTVEEAIHVYNPASGFIQNCNSTPYTSAGPASPDKKKYPFYMATEPENFRGINAVRVLEDKTNMTLDKMIAAGYDTYLTGFESIIPALVKRFEGRPDTSYNKLAEPIALLAKWDFRCGEKSVATTLAMEWGARMIGPMSRMTLNDRTAGFVERVNLYAASSNAKDMLDALLPIVNDLERRFGTWKVEWGTINRYQRLTGKIDETYSDSKPSLPSGFASATWGCLPSFVSAYRPLTDKRYGYSGNSFICAVEFGKKVKAKSLLAGGNSSNPASPHFSDQAEMYTKGIFKDVLFYKEDIIKKAEKTYHPGE